MSSSAPEKLTPIQRLMYWCGHMGLLDGLMRKRAGFVVRSSHIEKYLLPNGSYLDIGSGLGHITEALLLGRQSDGLHYLALDPVHSNSRKVQQRLVRHGATKHSLFVRGLGEELPIRSSSVDGVLLFFVLHHIPPDGQAKVFAETKRVLKSGGLLFLTEDTPETADEYERNVRWDRRLNWEPEHLGHYYRAAGDWAEFLGGHGFELLESAPFVDRSRRKNEGLIRHTSLILKYCPN
ncbi:MAG TPA: methyltransferase domain-containing protein [Chloroflexota bacterium]|nr:methyltransferase domain-containing protein [Chloroflexota bacterium]